jgi:hypothetical protein
MTRPTPRECVRAIDRTYKGEVDLSEQVVVGDPVQKSPLHWVVPYDVKDAAGNRAETVWRDVIVQEVDLDDVKDKVREEVLSEQQAEMKKAIEKAIREEKVKWERLHEGKVASVSRSRKEEKSTCPSCPKCAPSSSKFKPSKDACEPYCAGSDGTCSLGDQHMAYAIILWLEDAFPPRLVPFLLLAPLVTAALLILRWIFGLIFNPRSSQSYDYGAYGDHREGDELFYSPTEPTAQPQASTTPGQPPRQSLSQHDNGAFFSPNLGGAGLASPPPSNGILGSPPGSRARQESRYDESIYASTPIITPSRTGDGVQRRSPYR